MTFIAPLFAMTSLVVLFVCGPAFAFGLPEEVPVPQDSREFFIDESKLPFDAIPGLNTTRLWGIDKGAGFRIEVPENWNGDLIMYAHGIRIPDTLELTVDSPPLRAYWIANGYAWAASSFSRNYYDVRAGVESTNSLARYFKKNVAEPDRIFITGFSMGGHVIGAAIEQFPNVECGHGRWSYLCRRIAYILGELSGGVRYAGAAPMCGNMGDADLFNYFGDFLHGSEAIAGVEGQFPVQADFFETVFLPTVQALYVNWYDLLDPDPNVAAGATLSATGENLRHLTTILSGGPRPLADFSFRFYQQLLFSFAGSDGTLDGVVSGNIYDNIRRVYQLDTDAELTPDEQAINDSIIRIARGEGVNPYQGLRVRRVPVVTGRITIPVLSVHTLGDLFVPFSMEQIYAREVAAWHRSDLLVSRATRAVGHCEFSAEELIETFDDLIEWVNTGVRPAGDDILDPETVAEPLFGCQFSRGTTATRPFAPCPE